LENMNDEYVIKKQFEIFATSVGDMNLKYYKDFCEMQERIVKLEHEVARLKQFGAMEK